MSVPTSTTIAATGGTLTPSYQAWFATLKPGGNFNTYFQSGYIQYAGPNGFTGNINFEFGTSVPNPSGTPGPFLLLGSGGGNGTPAQFWVGTDEAYDNVTPGNTLGITAGETQPAGQAPGGLLWLIGGASFGGLGGALQLQGGTSLNGNGGYVSIQGGNSTGGIPGDVFVSGGQNGVQGANVHLIASMLNGFTGVQRFRMNSDIQMDFIPIPSTAANGAVGFQIYIYGGGGYGTAGQAIRSAGPGAPVYWG